MVFEKLLGSHVQLKYSGKHAILALVVVSFTDKCFYTARGITGNTAIPMQTNEM